MKRQYLLPLALLLLLPLLYLLPSYGVLLGASILALLAFSLGVGALIALMTGVEKLGVSVARVVRRSWAAVQRSSQLHHP